jgi:hypothetical protein
MPQSLVMSFVESDFEFLESFLLLLITSNSFLISDMKKSYNSNAQ